MSGRKKLILLGSLAAVVCVGFHVRLWVGKPVPVVQRVGSTAICRIVRVRLPDPPGAFAYELVARKKMLQLVRPPSTQPKLITAPEYAMMTGDGSFETVSSEDEQLSMFEAETGAESAKWDDPANVDIAFVEVDTITGVARRLRREPGTGDTVGIGIRVHWRNGSVLWIGSRSLILPPSAPASTWASSPDTEADWIDDELILRTYSATSETHKDRAFQVDVVLRRRRKP